jgi:hypothetical protein
MVLSGTLRCLRISTGQYRNAFSWRHASYSNRNMLCHFFGEQAHFEIHGEATDGPEGFPRHEI